MCLFPKLVPFSYDYDTDKYTLHFGAKTDPLVPTHSAFSIPCGKCVECLSAKSSEWSHRIMDEARCHDKNVFITLTYNDDYCPEEVNVRDIQLFLKRLFRQNNLRNVRRFYCAEYGSKNGRPHYHLILFGYCPDDLEFFFTKNGVNYYRSKTIEKAWSCEVRFDKKVNRMSIGYVLLCEVNACTAKYCCKYMQKGISLHNEIKGRRSSFIRMSNRPGIGYLKAISINEPVKQLQYNGQMCSIPRYYLKVLKREKPLLYLQISTLLAFRRQRVLNFKSKEYLRYRSDYSYKLNMESTFDLNELNFLKNISQKS